MKRILDAHGLMVFLEKEPGFEKIESLFKSAADKGDYLLITSVNLGEVFYIILRECGEDKAQEVEEIVQTLPIKVIDADCFAAALASMHKGELITGDPEFKAVEKQIKIMWIISK